MVYFEPSYLFDRFIGYADSTKEIEEVLEELTSIGAILKKYHFFGFNKNGYCALYSVDENIERKIYTDRDTDIKENKINHNENYFKEKEKNKCLCCGRPISAGERYCKSCGCYFPELYEKFEISQNS